MRSPHLGVALDRIAGPLTASLTCINKKRSSICIEDDRVCFRYGIGLTRIHATSAATREELVEYVESSEYENEGDKTGNDSKYNS